jgi:hypothetical protein
MNTSDNRKGYILLNIAKNIAKKAKINRAGGIHLPALLMFPVGFCQLAAHAFDA